MRPLLVLSAMFLLEGCVKSCFQPGIPSDDRIDTQKEESDPPDSPVDSKDSPVDTTPPPPCDQPEAEPNYNSAVANQVLMEYYACGTFETLADFDVFTFDMPEQNWLRIDVDAADRGSAAYPILTLDSDEGFTAGATRGPNSNDPYIVVPTPEADTWFVWLTDAQQGYGEGFTYRFMASSVKAPVSWTHSEIEGHDTLATAMPITEDMTVYGTADSATEFDWYSFKTPDERSSITVTINAHKLGSPLISRLMLYELDVDDAGNEVEKLINYWDESSSTASLDPDFTLSNEGGETWYLKVRYLPTFQYGPLYWYTLDIDVE